MLIATLAKRESIPEILELILLDLKRAWRRPEQERQGRRIPAQPAAGRHHYRFAVLMQEGPLAPLPGASETAFKPRAECADVEACGTRLVMPQVRDAIARVLDGTTLADVMKRVDAIRGERNAEEALMDYI
jgi:hypothetical protein